MKSYTFSVSRIVQLVVCGVVLVAPGPGLAATKLRFSLVQDYLLVVPVTINGAGPFDFIFDTGTTTTIIDSRLAAELGLQATDRLTLVTLTGQRPFFRSWLQSASLGAATASHVEVVWDDRYQIKAIDRKIRGILGLNFMDAFNYLINYAARTIEVEGVDETSSRISGPRIPIDHAEGKLIISATTRANARSQLRFSLDSGVGAPVVYTPAPRQICLQSAGQNFLAGTASTLAGSAGFSTAPIVTLDIGEHRMSGLTAALLPKVNPESQIEDGVLPTVLFRSIYINNKEGYVVLNPVIANDSGIVK